VGHGPILYDAGWRRLLFNIIHDDLQDNYNLGIEDIAVDSLWHDARVCFDTDDGSLPGIEIARLSPPAVSAIYAMLRRRSRLRGDPPEFWSRTKEASVLVDSVPDAARLVAAGEAEAFHHCIEGVVAGGVELPVVGVFVRPDSIELDYRMGREWGPPQIAGFFGLLGDCCALGPGAVIVPADFEGPPYPDRFLKAWSSYKTAAGLTNG
jgi:hypothetical protein